MGIYFEGDIDYRYSPILEPEEFGCISQIWEQFYVDSDSIEEIQEGIQKYEKELAKYGVDVNGIELGVLDNMSDEEFKKRWPIKQEDEAKVFDLLYAYHFGRDILKVVEEKGDCFFEIPA